MKCLNLSIPTTYKGKKTTLDTVYKDLSNILGSEKAAYAALAYNEGFSMENTPIGKPSIMFQELQRLTNDYNRSTTLKANAMSSAFAEKFGDWVGKSNNVGILTKQVEPKIFSNNGFDYYIDKNSDILPVFPGHDYTGADVNKVMEGQSVAEYLPNTPFNNFLSSKASKYGIKVRGAETVKTKNILRDVIERDTQRLTPSKRSIRDKRIEDFINKLQDYSEFTDVKEILDIHKNEGPQALVDTIWETSKANTLNNIIAEDHPKVIQDVTFYDKLRDITLYPLGDYIHTFDNIRETIDTILGVDFVLESKEILSEENIGNLLLLEERDRAMREIEPVRDDTNDPNLFFDSLGIKVTKEDFDKFKDPNSRADATIINAKYISPTAAHLDVVTENFDDYHPGYPGNPNDVTPQDIVDFIVDRVAFPEKYTKPKKRKVYSGVTAERALEISKEIKTQEGLDKLLRSNKERLSDEQHTILSDNLKDPIQQPSIKTVDPIQQAMSDANIRPKNKALFIERINTILNYTKDSPQIITAELASTDYAVALKIMDDALGDMISDNQAISDTYYTKVYETLQQLYLNSNPKKEEAPYKNKKIAKYSTEDIILIRAENRKEERESNKIIDEAIENGAYTFVFAPTNISSAYEKRLVEKLVNTGAKTIEKDGALYVLVQSAPTKITTNEIVTPTVTKVEKFKTYENTDTSKAIPIIFTGEVKEVDYYDGNITQIKYRHDPANVEEALLTVRNNPSKQFFFNNTFNKMLDGLFKAKQSQGGYPNNLILTETAVKYLKTKQEVYNKKNPHKVNTNESKSIIETKINTIENTLESKTFEDTYGNKMEDKSFQKALYEITSKRNIPYSNNITKINTFITGSKKEKNLFSIAPEDVLYTDKSDTYITRINEILWESIRPMNNDTKLAGGITIKEYNKLIYNDYKRDILKILGVKGSTTNTTTEEFLDNNVIWEEEKIPTKQSSIEDLKNIAGKDLQNVQDILSSNSITHEDFLIVRNKIEQWKAVGDFSDPERNPYLTLAEIDDINTKAIFAGFAAEATKFEKQLNILGAQLTTNDINENYKKSFTFDDIIKLNSKVTGFIKNFFSLAHVDNPIVAHILSLVDRVQKKANIEAITDSERLAKLHKDTINSGFNPNDLYQTDSGGEPTGMLINPHSYEYSEKMSIAEKTQGGLNTIRNESVIIDISQIFATSKEAYIDSLAKVLDYDKAKEAVEDAQLKYNEYVAQRESFMQVNFGIPYSQKTTLSKRDTQKLNSFLADNNPVLRINAYNNKNILNYKELPGKVKDKYVTVVAKQRKKGDTGWYDKMFARVKNNTAAFTLWKFAQDITKRAKQNYNIEGLSDYALAKVDKDVIDMFRDNGVSKLTLQATGDYFMSAVTARTQNRAKEYDISGREIKDVKRVGITLESFIQDEMQKIRDTEYSNIENISEATWKAIFKQASKTVMANDKMDIFSALNNLNLNSRAFAYKSAIKPQIDVAMHYLNTIEIGKSRDPKVNNITEKDLQNTLDMTQYFVDKELYNISTPDTSYKLPITYYNIKEREIRDGIVIEMDNINKKDVLDNEDIANLEMLQEKLDSMGKDVTINSVIDALTKYMRFTTLGWNFANALANLGQGMLANFIYGFEAKFYTLSDLKDAHIAMATHRSKFRSMMHNFDILGDVTYGFKSVNPFTKEEGLKGMAKELLDPYAGVSIAEEVNQGFVAVAMMINKTVVNTETGEILSFWDALSDKGKLAAIYEYNGKTGSEAAADMALLVGHQINRIHGDYTSSLKINEQAPGRAVTLFHRWFFDPYMARFGAKRYNYMLDMEVKGYYRSIFSMFQEYGIDYKKFLSDIKTGNIDQTELENLRKVLGEITISVTALALAALVKLSLCKDMKECGGPEKYIINTMNRIEGETRMFSSPEQWYDLITNPVATTKYIKDLSDLSGYIVDWAQGDLKDEFGENPIWKMTKKNIPLLRRLELGENLMQYIH